jgi:CARDB
MIQRLSGGVAVFALLVFAGPAAAQNTACAGPGPAVASAKVDRMTPNGELNTYQLRVSVVNRGDVSQAGNVLQSVDIFRNGTKVDQKGVPPLKAGGTYSFVYPFSRNSDAGDGTTTFTFRMDPGQSCAGYVLRV